MTLLEIITECVKRDILVEVLYNRTHPSCGQLEFVVGGFSKSGTAILRDTPDGIVAYTRYNGEDEIKSFEDLARVAYYWYLDYKDREPFTQPSTYWAETFVEFGWLQKKTTQSVTYE
jgi:hypothetical protein